MDKILFAIWFFLPAGVANVTPILAAKAPLLANWNAPVDGGKKFRGIRVLGDHKTWRGFVTGIIAGIVASIIQAMIYAHPHAGSLSINYDFALSVELGLLLSVGALGGDSLKSFFKRQVGVASGKSWFPFDQLDYIIGAAALSAFIIRLSLIEYVWIFAIWFGLHLIFSCLGYLLKLKSSPI